MYGILSQEPIKYFMKSDDKKNYIENTDFFILESRAKNNLLIERLTDVFYWYSYFCKKPIYMGLFQDNTYNSMIKSDEVINYNKISKWGNIPTCSHEAGKNFEKVLDVTDRMPVNNEYMNTVMNKVIKNDFAKHTTIQVLLDGMNTDFEIINN